MGAKLEVPLEMVDYGLASGTAAVTFERTRLQLNDADYDAASFYFEVNANNANTTTAYTVQLVYWNGSSWADVTNGGISVAASTANGKTIRAGSAFTPQSGATLYAVKTPGTASGGQIRVYDARIIVVQTASATKTRIQIPLLSSVSANYSATNDNTISVEARYATAYGQQNNAYIGAWKYVAADWADIIAGATAFTLEVVSSAQSASYAGNHALAPTDALTTIVTGSAQGSDFTSTVISLKTAEFAASALTDGKVYTYVSKSAGTTTARKCIAYRAALYVRLSNAAGLSKFVCYRRVGHRTAADTTEAVLYVFRHRLTTANYGNGSSETYYLAAIGTDTTNEASLQLYDQSTTADSTTGSAVTGSGLNFNGTRQYRESSSFTAPTSGNYVCAYKPATTGTNSAAVCLLLVKVTVTGTSYPATGTIPAETGLSGTATVKRAATGSVGTTTALSAGALAKHPATGAVAVVSGLSGVATRRWDATGSIGVVTGLSGVATVTEAFTAYPATGAVDAATGFLGTATVKRAAMGSVGATTSLSGTAAVKRAATGSVGAFTGLSGSAVASATAGQPAASAVVTGISGDATVTSAPIGAYGTVTATTDLSGVATVTHAATGVVACATGTAGATLAKYAPLGSVSLVTGSAGTATVIRIVTGRVDVVTGLDGTPVPEWVPVTYPATGIISVSTGLGGAANVTRAVSGRVDVVTGFYEAAPDIVFVVTILARSWHAIVAGETWSAAILLTRRSAAVQGPGWQADTHPRGWNAAVRRETS